MNNALVALGHLIETTVVRVCSIIDEDPVVTSIVILGARRQLWEARRHGA